MSVKTRDHKNSVFSTTTDATEVPNRFMPPKQFKNSSFNENEMFPPNDFVSHQASQLSHARQSVEGTSHFGYANITEGTSFRPDLKLQQYDQSSQRQYSFAPQVKEESESMYSQSSNYPTRQSNPLFREQVTKNSSYPKKEGEQQIPWTPQPPLFQINENRTYHAQDLPKNSHQDINNEPQSSRRGYNYMSDQKNKPQPQLFLQQECLPQEVLFLLAEEDNHITKYRSRVEKEKAKVDLDFGLIKTEIINTIEELKIQMQNYIDDHYKRYISVYAAFKDEIIQFKQQKLAVPSHLSQPVSKTDLSNASNQNLIRELEDISYKNQLSKINQYVGDLSRARIQRIGEISKDLLQITSSGCNLYNTENTTKQLVQLKQEIKAQLLQRFNQMSDYIQPLNYLLSNNRQQSKMTTPNQSRQTNNSTQQFEQETYHHPHHMSKEQIPFNEYQLLPQNNLIRLQEALQQQQQKDINQEPIFSAPFSIPKQMNQFNTDFVSTHHGQSPDQCEQLQLSHAQSIQLNHTQMPLCFLQIREQLMATGSRDGKIKIWDGSREVKEFQGHVGGVCCLALIKQQGVPIYMISGSDHVDNSIIVWNLQTFLQVGTLGGHNAAVVALLSLEDGHTIISASYDKSLIIWGIDVDQQQAIQKIGSAHTNAVTCLTLTQDRQYFISGGLDNLLNIWKIKYRKDGRFESTYLEKTLKNTSIVCSMSSYSIRDQQLLVVGGKDGKLREWNILSGELERQVAVCVGPIVEMILFKTTTNVLVLSMSTKDKNLLLSNLESGENQVVDVKENINVEFGCGVFPKMLLHQNQLIVLSQSDTNQNITQYSIDWS